MSASLAPVARPRDGVHRWWIVAFWIGIVALYIGVRAVCLEADAPRRLAHGGLNTELLVEPVAKSHEARNWATTGRFQVSPVDNYQFWRPQAPFWVYPLAGAFRLFGTTYATLRMTATMFGLFGLVGVILLAHRRWGPNGAVLAGVFFATDNVGIFFGRSGLLEPIVAAYLILALYAIDRAFDHVAWLFVAMLLSVLALGTKLAALPAMPVFLFYGVWLLRRPAGVTRPGLWRAALVVTALVVGAAIAAYVMRPEFQRTLTWNFTHMVLAKDGGTKVDLDAVDPDAIGPGLAELPKRLKYFWFAFSVVGVMGLVEAGLRTRELVRRRASARDFLPVAMFLPFAVAVYAATFFAYRFVLLMGPPLLILAVDLVFRVAARVRERRGAADERRLLRVVGGVYATLHLAAWGYAITQRTYEVREAANIIQRTIGDRDDAVCIGLWSAPLILETTCKHFYVKRGFNATKAALVELKPTHLIFLDEKDDALGIVKTRWPELLQAAHPVQRLEVRGFGMDFFEVGEIPQPGKKKAKKKRIVVDDAG